MVVGKRGLGGSLVIVGGIVHIKVEYIMVALVFPPVESGEQGMRGWGVPKGRYYCIWIYYGLLITCYWHLWVFEVACSSCGAVKRLEWSPGREDEFEYSAHDDLFTSKQLLLIYGKFLSASRGQSRKAGRWSPIQLSSVVLQACCSLHWPIIRNISCHIFSSYVPNY